MLVAAALCTASIAHADPHWYEGERGHTRILHVSLTIGLGIGYVGSELLKGSIGPSGCRWCDPPGFDGRIRDALVWDNVNAARTLSNLTGYVGAPALGIGITALTALTADDSSWGRVIDDTIPVLETIAVSEMLTQIVKFSVGRQRPFAHYTTVAPAADDNLSFWSGHSVLAFGAVTASGMVARYRGSRAEPWIWGIGMPLAAATAYLRIAGDKHYFSDVLVGSGVGVASGLLIPRLLHRSGSLLVTPAANGVTLAGQF